MLWIVDTGYEEGVTQEAQRQAGSKKASFMPSLVHSMPLSNSTIAEA
jgi:hypothetical protein